MRKNLIPILLAVLCFSLTNLRAQDLESTLTVSAEGQAFWLFLDDVQVNEQPVKSMRVNLIPEGKYYMRVELNNQVHTSIGQNVVLNPGNPSIYN